MKKIYFLIITLFYIISLCTNGQDVITGGDMEDSEAWEISLLNTDLEDAEDFSINTAPVFVINKAYKKGGSLSVDLLEVQTFRSSEVTKNRLHRSLNI